MIRHKLIVLSLCAALAPSMAFADSNVSEADQEACTPDVMRLCQDFIPNEAPIVACLEAKKLQLSPACARVMFPPTAAKPAAKPAPHRKRRHKKPKHT